VVNVTPCTFNRECSAAKFIFFIDVATDRNPPPLLLAERGGFLGGGHDSCMTAAIVDKSKGAYRGCYGHIPEPESTR